MLCVESLWRLCHIFFSSPPTQATILVLAWREAVQNWRWLEVTNDRQPTCAAAISLISDSIACGFAVWWLLQMPWSSCHWSFQFSFSCFQARRFLRTIFKSSDQLLCSNCVSEIHLRIFPTLKWLFAYFIALCVFMFQFCYSRLWQTMLHCVMVKHSIFSPVLLVTSCL